MSSASKRFVILVGLLAFYSLLIYVSIKPHKIPLDPSSPPLPSPPRTSSSPSHTQVTPPLHPSGEIVLSTRPEIEKKVSAFIKVHKREDLAVRAAFSVYKLYPTMEILLVDDSPNEMTKPIPPTARYLRIPPNTGISYGRNFGVNETKTEYLLIMDDDWELTPQTHLEKAFELIERNKSLGIVSGQLCTKDNLEGCYGYQGSLGIIDGLLTYKEHDIREDMGNDCKLVDLAENTILARTEVLRKFPWDNQLTNAEHEDFFLSMKGHVLVASCNWFKIAHKRPALADYAGYVEDRDLNSNQDRLCKKWKLRGFNMQWAEWNRPCP